MTCEAGGSGFCIVGAGAAGGGRGRDVGVDFEFVGLRLVRAVAEREGEDSG